MPQEPPLIFRTRDWEPRLLSARFLALFAGAGFAKLAQTNEEVWISAVCAGIPIGLLYGFYAMWSNARVLRFGPAGFSCEAREFDAAWSEVCSVEARDGLFSQYLRVVTRQGFFGVVRSNLLARFEAKETVHSIAQLALVAGATESPAPPRPAPPLRQFALEWLVLASPHLVISIFRGRTPLGSALYAVAGVIAAAASAYWFRRPPRQTAMTWHALVQRRHDIVEYR